MAGLDAAGPDAEAPPRPAALHEGRPGESAWRTRHVSRLVALSHPRLERAGDDRHGCLVGLLPPDQRGRHRPLRPRPGRRARHRAALIEIETDRRALTISGAARAR